MTSRFVITQDVSLNYLPEQFGSLRAITSQPHGLTISKVVSVLLLSQAMKLQVLPEWFRNGAEIFSQFLPYNNLGM